MRTQGKRKGGGWLSKLFFGFLYTLSAAVLLFCIALSFFICNLKNCGVCYLAY